MALRDELPPASIIGGRCRVGALLESLDAETRAELTDMLANPAIQAIQLYGLARKKGWPVGLDGIQRHRRKDCKCL